MVSVEKLKQMLIALPDDAMIQAYEGEGIGLIIRHGERVWWIFATPHEEEDDQEEFYKDVEKSGKQ